jgi:hypothetical protein
MFCAFWLCRVFRWTMAGAVLSLGARTHAEGFASLCADRTAVERVYYQHRLGDKPPLEQSLPPALVEQLVRQELKKEVVLREHYGVVVTPALVEAEVQRINATTRAPEMLAEIKAALGNDANRFARMVARPLVVERLLRNKFDNDDSLHATIRSECERIRAGLLAARSHGATTAQLLAELQRAGSNSVSEITWQLAPRPAETNAPSADESEIKKRFGSNAQLLAPSSAAAEDGKCYFADLPAELQRILRAQLHAPGDVSAVIETTSHFLLYLAKQKTDAVLSAATLSLPKRRYEQWLNEQTVTP